MSKIIKIETFFTGGEGLNWALDEDLNHLKISSRNLFKSTSLKDSKVIFSVWPGGLLKINHEFLEKKIVICQFDNPPFHWTKQKEFSVIFKHVDFWIAHSSQSFKQAKILNLNVYKVPYFLFENTFFQIKKNVNELKIKYNIPKNKYIIANFFRDSLGKSLFEPKIQKGPDIFFNIVLNLSKKNKNIHILLAGPRRHWLRKKLEQNNIPFTYIGKKINQDDMKLNVLKRDVLNQLYACCDLLLLTSRWEGGPYSLLEGVLAKKKILTSNVGISSDLLDKKCIFENVGEAVLKINKDLNNNYLKNTVEKNHCNFQKRFSFSHVKEKMENFHKLVLNYDFKGKSLNDKNSKDLKDIRSKKNIFKNFFILFSCKNKYSKKCISIFRQFMKPPYGGGNQFMLALKKQFEKEGITVLNNEVGEYIDAYLFDSLWFDLSLLKRLKKIKFAKVIHRIDGPIFLYRGKDKDLDDKIFEINKQFATNTVIQSNYTFSKILEFGYEPINPIVLHNAVNSNIFNNKNFYPNLNKKIKIISTSWSDNVMKGADDYKWLDQNLNFDNIEYSFYGRIKANLKNIKLYGPIPSIELAKMIKNHHIYITASKNDPCSNALIEAMACGLPAICKNSGGHPELISFGGLLYDEVDQIPKKINKVVDNYDLFSKSIYINSLENISKQYISLMFNR